MKTVTFVRTVLGKRYKLRPILKNKKSLEFCKSLQKYNFAKFLGSIPEFPFSTCISKTIWVSLNHNSCNRNIVQPKSIANIKLILVAKAVPTRR